MSSLELPVIVIYFIALLSPCPIFTFLLIAIIGSNTFPILFSKGLFSSKAAGFSFEWFLPIKLNLAVSYSIANSSSHKVLSIVYISLSFSLRGLRFASTPPRSSIYSVVINRFPKAGCAISPLYPCKTISL